ncbi:hypothetical protein [Burkholderia humptydooensis]|uniref:hypothetical protein n=1 Tax=Burkholderia humptydooensis TaxID=430531 RepID=UPI0010FD6D69|nr:hypothetical protein [Burkholderia humptydooensis]
MKFTPTKFERVTRCRPDAARVSGPQNCELNWLMLICHAGSAPELVIATMSEFALLSECDLLAQSGCAARFQAGSDCRLANRVRTHALKKTRLAAGGSRTSTRRNA